jgi:hypothetical protein
MLARRKKAEREEGELMRFVDFHTFNTSLSP